MGPVVTAPGAGGPPLPVVTVGAGCAGTGPELARLGDLALLPAVLLGPVAAPGDRWVGWPGQDPDDDPGPGLRAVPGGVVHRPAAPLSAALLAAEVLPWWAARGLRPWLALRASTAGALAEALAVLRRGPDFAVVAGVEVDLTAPGPPDERVAVGGGLDRRRVSHSADPDRCRRLLARARELTPRGLPLVAKIGLESPDPLAAARAAVAGGATGLVLTGSAPVDPLPGGAGEEGGAGTRLAGPAVLPLTEALVRRLRTAVQLGRVPVVPLLAAGGVHDLASARALLAAGTVGVQLGTAVLGDPGFGWRLADQLPPEHEADQRQDQAPQREERTSS